MSVTHPTPVIVLAGGASRRMGTDKRLVAVDGTLMLQRVIDRVAGHFVIVVIDLQRGASPVEPSADVRLVSDTRPGEGPLAALEAGLAATHAGTDSVLVVAADMPWLEPAVLDLLVQTLAADPLSDLACLADDGRPQPLPIACRRTQALARVSALLDGGERRLRAVLDGPGVTMIAESAWRRVDPTGRSLLDIDTPADLARVG